jgi:hypothetical protein
MITCLTHLVTQPTRQNNTLDLFLCNNPSLIKNVKILPGIADHDAVLVKGNISPIVNNQKPRKIYLFKRADWDGLRLHMENLENTHAEQGLDVKSLWKSFVQLLNSGIEKCIPSKIAKQKSHLPWVNSETKT